MKKKEKEKKFKSLFEYYGFNKTDEKQYPVISSILKELTPKRIEKEIKEVQEVKLPKELQKWIKEYEKVGKRNLFIWKWLWKMFSITKLPLTSKKQQKNLLEIKVLLTMFIILLDDIADKSNYKNLLNKLLKIPFNNQEIKAGKINKKEEEYLKISKQLWKLLEKKISALPKYKYLKDMFEYDLRQVINAMRYSYFINKNYYFFNKLECWEFMPYNMVALVYSGLDLMSSQQTIKFEDMGKIREMILYSQKMARIGNWISTWEREAKEKDFANGIFAHAIEQNIIKIKDLGKTSNYNKLIAVIKDKKIEKELFKKWESYFLKINQVKQKIKKLIFAEKFIISLKSLIIFHLISKGYK